MRTLALTLSTALVSACVDSPASDQHDQCAPPVAPMQLNFSVKLSTKLFINNIAIPGQCGAGAVLGVFGAPRLPAYLAFCAATSLGENPPTDANVAPLDARILGVATLRWTCVANNPVPQNVAIAGGGSVGGMEGPGLVGIAHPMRVAARGAAFGMVTSGRPNPLAEPAFQFFRPRLRPDIWNKLSGAITCGTDAQGRPTSNYNLNLLRTRFPSHKVWTRTPAGVGPAVLRFNAAQGNLSSLWFLPPIPPP